MRKFVKKEVQQALQTLAQSAAQIKELIQSENRIVLQQYLADCQNMAISVGTIIEKTEGEGTDAVKALEEYCECLYQVLSGNAGAEQKLRQSIEKAVKAAEEIPTKTEIVFLPYKASMWDSLESVWKAAEEDENCDAYVVPIPYFDKNADGSLGEMHYEGEQYPDYVPITSWQKYDIKNRRPDAIYIHNPYDECNYVTSVHPAFYSRELKKYTEQLVYIPYFVLQEIEPNNQAAIDEMKHFCILPGTIYADKVIVQSEKMKQIYVNEFLKEAEKNNLTFDKKQIEKKILGLGSPKYDGITSKKKEDMEIPNEWLRYIKRTNGSYKKIVLYNNSISAFLKYGEEMIKKMEKIFQIFKKSQEEVALWWRPHPLMQSTIKSMRPELLEPYQQIVDKYIDEDWGIYDETADLQRAIVFTDAYYGDGSSLVQLYMQTGKPILIANCKEKVSLGEINDV